MLNSTERFSSRVENYIKYRPSYPAAVLELLSSRCGLGAGSVVADVGSGTGILTELLLETGAAVFAVEPNLAMREAAERNLNDYGRFRSIDGTAEATTLAQSSVDLITASQAFHWFDHPRFFDEVRRIARPGAVVAVWCYGIDRITPEIDAVVDELYTGYLGTSWEPERRLVENLYRGVAFPFDELAPPRFEMEARWRLEHLVGYIETWSALGTYRKTHADDPMQVIVPKLERVWGDAGERLVTWPVGMRAGRV